MVHKHKHFFQLKKQHRELQTVLFAMRVKKSVAPSENAPLRDKLIRDIALAKVNIPMLQFKIMLTAIIKKVIKGFLSVL